MNRCIALLLMLFSLQGKPSYSPADYIQWSKQALSNRHIYQAFFCPQDKIKQILLGLIYAEKQCIYACLYQITDTDIVDALIAARKKGVKIEIITDKSCLNSPYNKIQKLRRNGIPVHVYCKGAGIMHNKFFLFGRTIYNKRLLWTGSANATAAGTTRNQENVIVLEQLKLFTQYHTYFKELKKKIRTKRSMIRDVMRGIAPHYYNSFLADFQASEV